MYVSRNTSKNVMVCVILLFPSPSSTYTNNIKIRSHSFIFHYKKPSVVNSIFKCFKIEYCVVTLVIPMTQSIALKNNNDARRGFKGRR